jgi:nitric oxide reductase activation protein
MIRMSSARTASASSGNAGRTKTQNKALTEAKHLGITPFALTVDKEGHDYLGQMAGDIGYEIVNDIEMLPSRLPTLYRKLTE